MIKQYSKVFFYGLVISFLGSLPLGTLNLFTTYISVSEGVYAALVFCYGCILSELIFVRLLVISLNWISQRQRLLKVLEWITIVIIITLAIFSFIAAIKGTPFSSSMPLHISHPFWSGILLGTLDPTRVPFWFMWSTFLLVNKILIPSNGNYNFYVTGIGLGSLLGFLVFIYGGTYLIGIIKTHQDLINWTIGGLLLVTAIIQVYRTFKRSSKN